MASKDQAVGALIFLACAVVIIVYIALLFVPQLVVNWLIPVLPELTTYSVRLWVIAIPVLLAFVAILAIGAWIGWTMATTPPPKPFEEIETEEAETKKEEK
jgi:predicted DNA-binding transcriptional regulator